MMSTETRSARTVNKKIDGYYDEMEEYITVLTREKAVSSEAATKLQELTDAIAAIGNAPLEAALNSCALIVEIRAKHTTIMTNADAVITSNRSGLAVLNDTVAVDGDCTAQQKQDFLNAKINEV